LINCPQPLQETPGVSLSITGTAVKYAGGGATTNDATAKATGCADIVLIAYLT
jgi:hypothetical protein